MSIFFGMPKEEFEANGKTKFRDASAPFLKKLDYLLTGKKFFAGDHVTLIDFFFYESLELGLAFTEDPAQLPGNIAMFHANFSNLPQIQVNHFGGLLLGIQSIIEIAGQTLLAS